MERYVTFATKRDFAGALLHPGPRRPMIELHRKKPLSGHVLDAAVAAASPYMGVQARGCPALLGGLAATLRGR
jgi:hypothetical protein